MNIINSNLKFKSLIYGSVPNKIILHHADSKSCSIYDVHRWHINKEWSGCGYHFFISKDGVVYRGRPEDSVGAHTKGYNKNSIGICVEGDFSVEIMTGVQYKALLELLRYISTKYKINRIYGHRELNATECPGRNFPLSRIKNEVLKGKKEEASYTGYLLKINSNRRDNNVKMIQEKLIKLGYAVGSHGADGYFGRSTYDAVVRFQRERGLLVDGVVGERTWNRIMR